MPEIRYFKTKGRLEWSEWVNALRFDPATPMPEGLLSNPELTSRVPGGSIVAPRIFATKLELAQTLAPFIVGIRAGRLAVDRWPGLWDWLAASTLTPSARSNPTVDARSRRSRCMRLTIIGGGNTDIEFTVLSDCLSGLATPPAF